MKTEWEANADAARRREPTVGQEAVASRSRMRRLVRRQWLTQRHGRLNTACCLSVEGVATTKQRLDRAVGPAAAPCAQIPPRPQRFFNELKSHPSANYEKRLPGKVLKWIATVNAAAKAGATEREVKAMDEYVAIWQWYGENADWQLMEEIVDGPNGEYSQYSFMHQDSPEYQRLWTNTWRT